MFRNIDRFTYQALQEKLFNYVISTKEKNPVAFLSIKESMDLHRSITLLDHDKKVVGTVRYFHKRLDSQNFSIFLNETDNKAQELNYYINFIDIEKTLELYKDECILFTVDKDFLINCGYKFIPKDYVAQSIYINKKELLDTYEIRYNNYIFVINKEKVVEKCSVV